MLLKSLFPKWETLTNSLSECEGCTSILAEARQDNQHRKRTAELEKVRYGATYRCLGANQRFSICVGFVERHEESSRRP